MKVVKHLNLGGMKGHVSVLVRNTIFHPLLDLFLLTKYIPNLSLPVIYQYITMWN